MQGFEFLQRLELAGNPVSEPPSGPGGGPPKARGANAYRDEVVLMSASLVSLDGKEITMQQRRFLQDREMMRRRRKPKAKGGKPGPGPGQGKQFGGAAAGGGGGAPSGGGGTGQPMAPAEGKANAGAPGLSVGLAI